MAILKVWSPGGRSKDAKEGQREPEEQRRGLSYRTLPAYVVAAAIWMALLGVLYLYFVFNAPKELKRRIEQEERLGRVLHLDEVRSNLTYVGPPFPPTSGPPYQNRFSPGSRHELNMGQRRERT